MKNFSNLLIKIIRFLLNNKHSLIIIKLIPYLRLILLKFLVADGLMNKIKKIENYSFKEIIKLILYFIFKIFIYFLAIIGFTIISYYNYDYTDILNILINIYNTLIFFLFLSKYNFKEVKN